MPADLPAAGLRAEKTAPLAELEVFPAEIQLTTARDRQSIVVQATFADGITRDVTEEASMHPGRPEAASGATARVFYPAADGATTLDGRLRRQDRSPCR